MRGRVKVGGRVHRVSPVGFDDADGLEEAFDGRSGGGGGVVREGGVVDEERLLRYGAVGDEPVFGDEVSGDAEGG